MKKKKFMCLFLKKKEIRQNRRAIGRRVSKDTGKYYYKNSTIPFKSSHQLLTILQTNLSINVTATFFISLTAIKVHFNNE